MIQVGFCETIYRLIERLPRDKVTTYGDLSVMACSPRVARIVGGIARDGSFWVECFEERRWRE